MKTRGARRRRFATVIALTVAALAAAAPASAGKVASSEVKLRIGEKLNQPPLFGRVTSENPKCVAGRTIWIFVDAPGSGPLDKADNPTNAQGKWKFSSQLQGGTAFHAKVKAKKVGGITCESAVSGVKSF
jgi:hypothetical protein